MTEDFYSKLEDLQDDLFAHQENKGAKFLEKRNRMIGLVAPLQALDYTTTSNAKARKSLIKKAKEGKLTPNEIKELRGLNKSRSKMIMRGNVIPATLKFMTDGLIYAGALSASASQALRRNKKVKKK